MALVFWITLYVFVILMNEFFWFMHILMRPAIKYILWQWETTPYPQMITAIYLKRLAVFILINVKERFFYAESPYYSKSFYQTSQIHFMFCRFKETYFYFKCIYFCTRRKFADRDRLFAHECNILYEKIFCFYSNRWKGKVFLCRKYILFLTVLSNILQSGTCICCLKKCKFLFQMHTLMPKIYASSMIEICRQRWNIPRCL